MAECPTGTGKSLGALIPVIDAIHQDPSFRAVISTETNALQDQYTHKDLPFLQRIYSQFSFCDLKGRSHYLCLDSAKSNSLNNKKITGLYRRLEPITEALGTGERGDVEKRVGKLDDETWSMLSGSKIFCNDNQCDAARCFTMRARAKALASNIVVVNHALLQADIDMKDGQNSALTDGLLGDYDTLIVDEAHALEQVLIDGWTEEITGWELLNLTSAVSSGMEKSTTVSDFPEGLPYRVEKSTDDIKAVLDITQNFFELQYANEEWRRLSVSVCEQRVVGGSSQLLSAMEAFETDIPAKVEKIQSTLDEVKKHLTEAVAKAREEEVKGVLREMNKGLRAAKQLSDFCSTLLYASKSKTGVVRKFDIPHAVVLDGYESKDGTHRAKVRTVPLDVSEKVAALWQGRSAVLLSATLTDLTTGTFGYTALSLGFPEHETLKTESAFTYRDVQQVYVTPARLPVVDTVDRAQYSFEELVELLEASDGRALVLFTAKAELEDCAERLQQMYSVGRFSHPILVQSQGADKQALLDKFKSDKHSVLIASKSFFTGVDVPGDALSLVVLCKFPLAQFNVVCRKQIDHWKWKGYPTFYENRSLTTFQQAAGRLIRSSGDHGVVAILDQRVTRATEKVSQTALIGVRALGSDVIRSTEDVRKFLASRG
jgi:ATP-dependent DNA helicase DinG